jgi:hypothetical protein
MGLILEEVPNSKPTLQECANYKEINHPVNPDK